MSLMLPHVLRLQLRKRGLSEAEVRLIGCRTRPAPAKDSRLTLFTTPRCPSLMSRSGHGPRTADFVAV